MLNKLERWWAVAILFTNGWIYALPITEAHLPVWLTPIQILHGVFVHEFLLLAYLPFLLMTRGGRFPRAPYHARRIAVLIAILAALGLISDLANARPLREFVAAGRYLLLLAYFVVAVYWSRKNGATFVLRNFLVGIAAAGVVNLYYTFTINTAVQLGGLPFLLGEQGPGGYLGMSVVLSAWLMLARQSRRDAIIAVAACAIGLLAVTISFSKLAMLMAAAGIVAWMLVLWRDFNTPRMRKWYAAAFVVVSVILWTHRDRVEQYARGARTFFDYKFRYVDTESLGTRSQYFLITAEILTRHPVFGVGYGGFYDAAMETNAEKSPRAAKEDPEAGARGESNPHSSFLYYTMANGFGGLVITLMLIWSASDLFAGSLFRYGLAGKGVWAALSGAYLVFGLTLPTLFNSSILYLPAALAVCLYAPRLVYARKVSGQLVRAHV
jgi:hypothetical protein